MTPRQVLLHARSIASLSLIHEAAEKIGPPHSTGHAGDIALGIMRDVYGGVPGFAFGRPGRTLEDELEEYGMLDAAWYELQLIERAARRGETV